MIQEVFLEPDLPSTVKRRVEDKLDYSVKKITSFYLNSVRHLKRILFLAPSPDFLGNYGWLNLSKGIQNIGLWLHSQGEVGDWV